MEEILKYIFTCILVEDLNFDILEDLAVVIILRNVFYF